MGELVQQQRTPQSMEVPRTLRRHPPEDMGKQTATHEEHSPATAMSQGLPQCPHSTATAHMVQEACKCFLVRTFSNGAAAMLGVSSSHRPLLWTAIHGCWLLLRKLKRFLKGCQSLSSPNKSDWLEHCVGSS